VRELDVDRQPVLLHSPMHQDLEALYTDYLSSYESARATDGSSVIQTKASNCTQKHVPDVIEEALEATLSRLNQWLSTPSDFTEHQFVIRKSGLSSVLTTLRVRFPALRYGVSNETHTDLREQEVCTVTASRDTIYSRLLSVDSGLSVEDVIRLYTLRAQAAECSTEICRGADKTTRTNVHQMIAAADRNLQLRTATTKGGISVIRVTKKSSRKRKAETESVDDESFSNTTTRCFVHFTLFKRSTESLHAIQQLAEALRVANSEFCIAGTKDKRALTYQRCSINSKACQGMSPVEIAKYLAMSYPESNHDSTTSSGPVIAVGNFSFETSPLRVGHLLGNQFSITVRRLLSRTEMRHGTSLREVLEYRKEMILREGFFNLFGTQRTGTSDRMSAALFRHSNAVPLSEFEDCLISAAHQCAAVGPRIGKCLLLRNFKEAFELILLGLRPVEDDGVGDDTADCVQSTNERVVEARRLYGSGADLNIVFSSFPHYCTRERTLIRGLLRYGRGAFELAIQQLPHSTRSMYITAYQSLLWNTVAAHRARLSGTVQPGDLVHGEGGSSTHVLMPVEIEGPIVAHSLSDVVIPLFGSTVHYPSENCASGAFYKKLLEVEGLHDAYSHPDMPKGAYRSLVVSDIYSNINLYFNSTNPWLFCIVDNQQRLDALDMKLEATEKTSCLHLEFSLPVGSFATALLACLLNNDSLL